MPISSLSTRNEPGSLVTVFRDPPRPAGELPAKPPVPEPGTEWFALLEDAGRLHFQLLLPSGLAGWFARARVATRWAVYRADDSTALTAVAPARTSPTP